MGFSKVASRIFQKIFSKMISPGTFSVFFLENFSRDFFWSSLEIFYSWGLPGISHGDPQHQGFVCISIYLSFFSSRISIGVPCRCFPEYLLNDIPSQNSRVIRPGFLLKFIEDFLWKILKGYLPGFYKDFPLRFLRELSRDFFSRNDSQSSWWISLQFPWKIF